MNWKVMVVLVSVAASITVITTYSVYQCQKKQIVALKNGYMRNGIHQGAVTNTSWVKPQDASMNEQALKTIADLAIYVNRDAQLSQALQNEIAAIKRILGTKRDKK